MGLDGIQGALEIQAYDDVIHVFRAHDFVSLLEPNIYPFGITSTYYSRSMSEVW